jgi:pimeloyl-ACP methyl ester carboxylesterase
MERASVDGLELEYELKGSGEPVVLIHWGLCAKWAEPLMGEPALADCYTLLRYHRAGFAASDRSRGPISIAKHAAHCASLMRQLGIEQAHIAGHSSSAVIALQLALDFPDAVHSLVLMEPARPIPRTDEQAAFIREFVAPAMERYRAGDRVGAVDTFAQGVFGSAYRDTLERELPGVFEQAIADADAFFAQELPALQEWPFTRAEATRITQPVLGVLGENTAPTFPPRMALLLSWLPHAEPFELPGTSHLLHFENAQGTAEALASFFARNGVTDREARTSAASESGRSARRSRSGSRPRR